MNNGTAESSSSGTGSKDAFISSREKDYKLLYQQEFERRNTLMKLAQKATRDYDELSQRYKNVSQANDEFRTRLRRKDLELKKLENASQAVYQEYQDLKCRFEEETETMNKTLSQVSEWYTDNQALRQETATLKQQNVLLQQKISGTNATSVEETKQISLKEQGQEHEKQIHEFMAQITKLERALTLSNNELDHVNQGKFEAQEQLVEIKQENVRYGHENEKLQRQLRELECMEQRLAKVSTLVIAEVEKLQSKINIESDMTQKALSTAAHAEREYAALARQSAIVLTEAINDERVKKALEDVHDLTSSLLKEREQSNKTIHFLEVKLASLKNTEKEEEISLMETKIKFLEEENIISRRGMFEARNENSSLHVEVRDLRLHLKAFQATKQSPTSIVLPPLPKVSPPPPPPPPPPVPPTSAVINLTSVLGSSRKKLKEVTKSGTTESGGGMNELIDQLKKGGINLKQTSLGNNFLRKPQNKKPTRPGSNSSKPTDAVQEMKNLLATMKKSREGQIRPSTFGKAKIKLGPKENETHNDNDNLDNTQVIEESQSSTKNNGENENLSTSTKRESLTTICESEKSETKSESETTSRNSESEQYLKNMEVSKSSDNESSYKYSDEKEICPESENETLSNKPESEISSVYSDSDAQSVERKGETSLTNSDTDVTVLESKEQSINLETELFSIQSMTEVSPKMSENETTFINLENGVLHAENICATETENSSETSDSDIQF